MIPLKTPDSYTSADQCREMGLVVGDVIVGRETYGLDWSESMLTLIFLGDDVAVFSERRRNNLQPVWREDGESSGWTLKCREWHKLASD